MQIIYSTTHVKHHEGQQVIDPAKFDGPIKGATMVYYSGANLRLTYGYETLGIPVKKLSELPKPKTSSKGE